MYIKVFEGDYLITLIFFSIKNNAPVYYIVSALYNLDNALHAI